MEYNSHRIWTYRHYTSKYYTVIKHGNLSQRKNIILTFWDPWWAGHLSMATSADALLFRAQLAVWRNRLHSARGKSKHARCICTRECKIELVGMVSFAYIQRGYWNNYMAVLESFWRQEVSMYATWDKLAIFKITRVGETWVIFRHRIVG